MREITHVVCLDKNYKEYWQDWFSDWSRWDELLGELEGNEYAIYRS